MARPAFPWKDEEREIVRKAHTENPSIGWLSRATRMLDEAGYRRDYNQLRMYVRRHMPELKTQIGGAPPAVSKHDRAEWQEQVNLFLRQPWK